MVISNFVHFYLNLAPNALTFRRGVRFILLILVFFIWVRSLEGVGA